MIIGINGYIGSGKDTVGRMIQYFTYDKIYIRNMTFEEFDKYATKEGFIPFGLNVTNLPEFQIKKFAGKLKQIASLMTGISVEKFEDQDFKKTNMSQEWNRQGMPITVREFLQRLGTDAIRDNLHDNAWVNSLMCDYKAESIGKYGDVLDYPNWIITDTRFPNEAKAIKDKGGIVIRINRPPNIDDILIWGDKSNRHISETALDDWEFDEVIENDNGLDKLLYLTEQVLVKHEII